MPQAAYASDDIVLPPMPGNIQVLTGDEPFLLGHGVGTQNYVCLPSGAGVAYKLFTPEATLFDDHKEQLITHFFSPNPDEINVDPALVAIGPIRVAWQHSRDASTVWGEVKSGDSSNDAAFVAQNAIPWLKVTKVGVDAGPAGGDILTRTTFIRRLKTAGGVAPRTGCSSTADVGNKAFVPYTADYVFYRKSGKPAGS